MDEVQTEEVASQQQTLAVAEGSLQEMTVVHTRWLNKERSLASKGCEWGKGCVFTINQTLIPLIGGALSGKDTYYLFLGVKTPSMPVHALDFPS